MISSTLTYGSQFLIFTRTSEKNSSKYIRLNARRELMECIIKLRAKRRTKRREGLTPRWLDKVKKNISRVLQIKKWAKVV